MMRKLLYILLLLPLFADAQIITTIAGTGSVGHAGDGGLSTTAELNSPIGLNFDHSGNLLICQQLVVRKVNLSTGIISTIAGCDTASGGPTGWGNGGPATCASVVRSCAICVDAAGNYYIADQWSSQIRKINIATNIITSYAGTGSVGSIGDGGPATAAKFNTIGCVHIDTVTHSLYIADAFNYKVRKVNMTSGIITAFAGTGISGYSGDGVPATTTKFGRVMGLCTDRNGNVYIGDWDNARIRKVDIATGIVTTYAGNGTPGYFGDGLLATLANISKPTSLCMDTCDNMYFADENNNVVRRIDAGTGIITTVAGNGTVGFFGDGGVATAAQFNHPTGVKIDNSGNLYVSDYYNHRVRKVAFTPPSSAVTVSIAALPNDTVCAGTPVTYVATAVGTGTPGYKWYKNGIIVSTVGNTYAYTPAMGDSLRCVFTSYLPCGEGIETGSSNIINMHVTPLTPPTISLASIPTYSASVGSTVTLNATVYGAGSTYSIQWYKNGMLFATTVVPVTTFVMTVEPNIITARVSSTDATACYDTTTSTAITIVEPEGAVYNIMQQTLSINIYPNPAGNTITVSSAGIIDNIAVTDIAGRSFLKKEIHSGNATVDISNLSCGIYLLQVTDVNGSKVIKRLMKK